tara:strand:- start:264 stop:395 length:132 start_codon:yes stop_codon:yes gene_type:complete
MNKFEIVKIAQLEKDLSLAQDSVIVLTYQVAKLKEKLSKYDNK